MKINLLDHGYVEFIEAWGTGNAGKYENRTEPAADYEVGIVEAARQSTQGSFRGWEQDAKLLKRLYDNHHATPFEFAGLVIEVQAPIFVFREWHRHRIQSYNEMSARYAPLPDLYYHADAEMAISRAHVGYQAANKQTAGIAEPNEAQIRRWLQRDKLLSEVLEEHYQEGLACGVPKELARKKMPVDHYSRMRAHACLRNWLAFLTLRMAPGVQYETRQYALAVGVIISGVFPQTWALFNGGKA